MWFKKYEVSKGSVGIIYRNNEVLEVKDSGVISVWYKESIVSYALDQPFKSMFRNEIIKANKELMDRLHYVNVLDDDFVIVMVNGKFGSVLDSGEYFFWKEVLSYEFVTVNKSNFELDMHLSTTVKEKLVQKGYLSKIIVQESFESYLKVDGVLKYRLIAGIHFFVKGSSVINVVGMENRNTQVELSGQELMTKDKANIRVSFFLNYKTNNIKKAITEFADFDKQLYTSIQLAIREYVGLLTLDELISRTKDDRMVLEKIISAKTQNFEIVINDFGIRDVILPGDMREMMNKVILAEKKAQANTIVRREDTASTRSLLNTAKLMKDNEMLFKLKEMEYMEKIADKITGISVNGNSQILGQLKTIFSK